MGKGMVSSSESQQQEHAKAQLDKISALQEQVEGLKTSSRKAESECTSLQSRLKAVEDRYRDEIQQLSQAAKTTETQLLSSISERRCNSTRIMRTASLPCVQS